MRKICIEVLIEDIEKLKVYLSVSPAEKEAMEVLNEAIEKLEEINNN